MKRRIPFRSDRALRGLMTGVIAGAILAGSAAPSAAASIGPQARPMLGRLEPASGPLTPDYGAYAWPAVGPVIRGFEPPPDPYSSGHRGIDIAAPFGSPLVAANDGVIAFAGWVGGYLFISIDHADGVRTTYSWVSAISVAKGQAVIKGQVIGATGHGHPDVDTPHLHFGAKVGSEYIDPMLLLEGGSVVGLIHLAPIAAGPGPR
jgi:murein DD-endopeptidase MepM/ murein hydrolase activator NlpD